MSTKIVTTETNYLARNNQFKVIVNTRTIEDPGIRMTPQILIHRKQVAIYGLLKEKVKTLNLIQSTQKEAIDLENNMVVIVNGREVVKTEKRVKSRQLFEYVDQILMPQFHRIDREIKALEIQVEQLKARL